MIATLPTAASIKLRDDGYHLDVQGGGEATLSFVTVGGAEPVAERFLSFSGPLTLPPPTVKGEHWIIHSGQGILRPGHYVVCLDAQGSPGYDSGRTCIRQTVLAGGCRAYGRPRRLRARHRRTRGQRAWVQWSGSRRRASRSTIVLRRVTKLAPPAWLAGRPASVTIAREPFISRAIIYTRLIRTVRLPAR